MKLDDKHSGERREQTEWHRVVVFGDGLTTIIERYLQKGSKVYVEGSLKTRKWTDQHNQERYATEVVLQPYNGETHHARRHQRPRSIRRPPHSRSRRRLPRRCDPLLAVLTTRPHPDGTRNSASAVWQV